MPCLFNIYIYIYTPTLSVVLIWGREKCPIRSYSIYLNFTVHSMTKRYMRVHSPYSQFKGSLITFNLLWFWNIIWGHLLSVWIKTKPEPSHTVTYCKYSSWVRPRRYQTLGSFNLGKSDPGTPSQAVPSWGSILVWELSVKRTQSSSKTPLKTDLCQLSEMWATCRKLWQVLICYTKTCKNS